MANFRTSSALIEEGRERARRPATGWLCGETAANESPPSNSLIPGKIQGISLKTPPPLALNPLNSEFVWTNSLHIEQGIFCRKQRSLLRELRKFYCESADVA